MSSTDNPPTARSMLPQDAWLCLFVSCRSCFHQAPADLHAIVDAGQGDRPLIHLNFRCTKCGSRRTNAVVMARSAMGVQPWKGDAEPTSSAAGHLRGQRPWDE